MPPRQGVRHTSVSRGVLDGLVDVAPQVEQLALEPQNDVNVAILLNNCQGQLCSADLDGDGSVDIDDFLALLAAWGPCDRCPEDLDGDGEVGITDFLELLAAWGPCP